MAHVHGAKAIMDASAVKAMDAAMGKISEATQHTMMGSLAKGAAATAGSSALKKVLTHPVVLIGVGFALGYWVHKYRKDAISAHQEE